MGYYCTVNLRRHKAEVGEQMLVRRFPEEGPVVLFSRGEIACIPHQGCRLKVVAKPGQGPSVLTPLDLGQIIRYQPTRWDRMISRDRYTLPNGQRVGASKLVGFKLELLPPEPTLPSVDAIIAQWQTEAKAPPQPCLTL